MITIPIIETLKAAGKAPGLYRADYAYTEFMSVAQGNLLYELVRRIKPKIVLEIGMGIGTGTHYVLQALADNEIKDARVISIDPSDDDSWTGVALKTIQLSGLADYHIFMCTLSEFALPQLLRIGTKWDFAIIDSNHMFDQTMVEGFYTDKGLSVGGSIAFHDINLLSVQTACNFIEANLGYVVDPIHCHKASDEMGAFKILTKTLQPERPWFHFIPFEVPSGDQMKPYLQQGLR